jgi:hypothetical protein
MEWLALIVFVVIVLIVVALKLTRQSGKSNGYPYIMNQVLFSPAERSFLGVLDQAIGDEYRVFGKVRVADVVSVKSMSDRSVRQQAFNRISAKHFDFVLCRKDDLTIIGAVELDDKSHHMNRRKDRDAFMVGLCNTISLPLIQVPAQGAYSVSDIRAKVLAAVNLVGAELDFSAKSHEEPITEAHSDILHAGIESPETKPPVAKSEGPVCPKCSLPMVRRRAKSGANAGQEFWGCSAFPKCRSIIPVSAQHRDEPVGKNHGDFR